MMSRATGGGLPRRRFLALTACAVAAPRSAASAAPQHWQGTAMGADVSLRVDGADYGRAHAFFREAGRTLAAIEARYSLFRGSELTRLNALGRLAHPSDDMQALLALARRVHDATAGAFDPTVQPLWQAIRTGRSPDPALLGFAEVAVGADEIRLPRPGMALTLNGIAQGWAADRLADTAARHGLTSVLIDTGEIVGRGRDWQAGIAAADGRTVRQIRLNGRALATSAPMGTRIGPGFDESHILDPRGGPARWSLVSISAESAAVADALSTAACVMDRDEIDAALAAFADARIEVLETA